MSPSKAPSYEQRREWRRKHILANDTWMTEMPKVELHVHIEGTMTPELRWKLSQRNKIPLTAGAQKHPLTSLGEVQDAYTKIRGRIGAGSADPQKSFTFFEAYYGGFDLLQTERDYYDLAMGYFERASEMNVRYCEPFFDPQGHTRRGIGMDVIMRGFRKAQVEAEERLNVCGIIHYLDHTINYSQVKSQWIMCFLRDMSVQSAVEQYEAALPYRELIVGVGLDSDEYDRPPSLFYELFQRARKDGFKLTAHCDFNQKDTHEHIHQVATLLGGLGAERIDHGLNTADRSELIDAIKARGVGLTICPCAYIRHTDIEGVFPLIRKLFDADVKISIASDDPAYMEDNWVLHNLHMVRDKCHFTNGDMLKLQDNAIGTCWASPALKAELLNELEKFSRHI